MTTTANTTDSAAAADAKNAELLTSRKENFKRLFNPKMALLLAKREEIKRMADNPALFEGVLTLAEVVKVENLMEEIKADIVKSLTFLAEYVAPVGEEAPKALRKKAEYDLFA